LELLHFSNVKYRPVIAAEQDTGYVEIFCLRLKSYFLLMVGQTNTSSIVSCLICQSAQWHASGTGKLQLLKFNSICSRCSDFAGHAHSESSHEVSLRQWRVLCKALCC